MAFDSGVGIALQEPEWIAELVLDIGKPGGITRDLHAELREERVEVGMGTVKVVRIRDIFWLGT